jgi:hypothetical protein
VTVDSTASAGIMLTVVTVVTLVAAIIAGELAPGSLVHRVLAAGGTAGSVACLVLIAIRFASVLLN